METNENGNGNSQMSPQDFFNSIEVITDKKEDNIKTEEDSLITRLEKERIEWTGKVETMSEQMKRIKEIPDLMTVVYTERQRAVDYYHYLVSLLIKINKKYRASYAERHDYWTFKAQIRYPNETSKNNKILSELATLVDKRETIENHSKFINSTISTIDNLIYAIPRRVELEQISRGK